VPPGLQILGLFSPVTIIGNLRKESVIRWCLIRHHLIGQFPDNIKMGL